MSEDRIRASDAEREEYARVVREGVTDGRLNLSEGDERLARVYGAQYRDELPPIVTDLPRPAGGPWGRGPGGPRPGGGPRPEWQAYREHREHRGWPGFGRPVGFVLVVAAILITIWAATGSGFFWPAIPLAFLALGLLRFGLCWRGARAWRYARAGEGSSSTQR